MIFLLACQQRHFVQRSQIRRQPRGNSNLSSRFLVRRHVAQDFFFQLWLFKVIVVDAIQWQLGDVTESDFVNHTIDRSPRTTVLFSKSIDRHTMTVFAVNDLLGRFGQRARSSRKNGLFRLFVVMMLKRVTNRFDTTSHLRSNTFGDLRRRTTSVGQTTSSVDNLELFSIGKLAKVTTSLDTIGVVLHEAFDATTQEAHSLTPLEEEFATDQALLSPSRDRLGRNVEPIAQLLNREDFFRNGIHGNVGGIGKIFHHQTKVFGGRLAGQ
mmetsp:Transcript_81128/g.164311  ORF Transcript_81128/g.164311 Transcript_81128/m.164311 type:complete len:268 (-) Transcript_81128:96-899(-)